MLDTEAGGPSLPARPLTVEGHMGLVHREARRCAPRARHLRYDDLVQEGVIGLMRGLEMFNPDLGVNPSTYLTIWIRQAIGRSISNLDREIRLPVYQLNRLYRQKRLRQEASVSLAQPLGENITLEDVLAGDVGAEDELLACLDRPKQDHDLARAISELPERLQRVLRGRIEGQTLQVIATGLGLSRERVRQLEIQALGLLRKALAHSRDTIAEQEPRSLSNWRAKSQCATGR